MISVIIPAFNEESTVSIIQKRVSEILKSKNLDYEILYVDDGSFDNTWNVIKKESELSANVRGIHFSRNFGKEAAILAGLNEAFGDCVVVIDCDMQHPPELIIDMYRLWEQGYEIVEGIKKSRGNERKLHGFAAKAFYSVIGKSTGVNMENSSDFKLMDRKVVNILKEFNEKNGFFRATSSWVGFKKISISFEVGERVSGETKWSSVSLIKYALRNITSFSTAPMQLVTVLGIITFIISSVFGCISLIQYFNGTAVAGFTTIILLLLILSSIIMVSIGVVGYYIARIFEEVKNRPLYIISQKCGEKDE